MKQWWQNYYYGTPDCGGDEGTVNTKSSLGVLYSLVETQDSLSKCAIDVKEKYKKSVDGEQLVCQENFFFVGHHLEAGRNFHKEEVRDKTSCFSDI